MILATIALAAAAAGPVPAPTLSALPADASAAPTASAAPIASAAPAASPSATASAGPTPVASAPATSPPAVSTATTSPDAYKYRYVPHQPAHLAPGVPQIFAVYLNSDRLISKGPIAIKVTTSPDAVKVVSRNGSREGVVPRVTAGDFEANSTLPKLPFIASGMTIDLEFVATGATGKTVSVKVPLKLK